jgi:hypothetical protein
MTQDEFRSLALALPEAIEQGHMGHPDFRVAGKIFAGLDQAGVRASLKLRPDQQDMLMSAEPAMFAPCAGAWGMRGWTWLTLAEADADTARSALAMAWRNTAPPKMQLLLGEQVA